MFSSLPTSMLVLGGLMTLMVCFLGVRFWLTPEKGLEFATHTKDGLPQVMVNRYFVMAMMMGGSLVYGRPEVVAFSFAVTGIAPLHDAWVYYKLGTSYQKHLIPAALSAVVAIWALMIHLNGGAM